MAMPREHGQYGRSLPTAIESEQYVLGGCMNYPEAIGRSNLEPGDFFRRDHSVLWGEMLKLEATGKPCDAVYLGEWMASQGIGNRADHAYMIELQANGFTVASVTEHAALIRERAAMRRAIDIGDALIGKCMNPDGEESVVILDDAIRELMQLTKSRMGYEHTLEQALGEAWRDAEDAYAHKGEVRGVPYGFTRPDKRLGGAHGGDLIFIGARPSMGKTALLVNCAFHQGGLGIPVGIISGEQSARQLASRGISGESGVAAEKLRSGDFTAEEWPQLSAGMRKLIGRSVFIYDRSAPTLDEVVRTIRRWKQEHGIRIAWVDYLQRIRVPRSNGRAEEVGEVARTLKTLARDLDIPIVVLAQVKAEVDTRNGNKRPSLGDIANSDEATREADIIAFLYRHWVYDRENGDPSKAELNVEKNRHGPCGRFDLGFDGKTMRFLDPELQPDYLDQPPTPRRARSVPVHTTAAAARAGDQ